MRALPLREIADAIHGRIVRGSADKLVHTVTKRADSLIENSLFFAVSGPPAAVAIPTGCIIVTDDPDWSSSFGGITTVYVSNIQQAIDRFMMFYRSLFNLPVIGITGTSGKTLAREMIHFILSQDHNIQATRFSNNSLSLNLDYLLAIDENTHAAVFEMGADYPGSLSAYFRCFQPTSCIILNIKDEGFLSGRSIEPYRQANGYVLEDLRRCPTLIINGDDTNINRLNLTCGCGHVVRFGTSDCCDVKASAIRSISDGLFFTLQYGTGTQDTFIPCYNQHHLHIALAVIAAVSVSGLAIDWKTAANRLSDFRIAAKNT